MNPTGKLGEISEDHPDAGLLVQFRELVAGLRMYSEEGEEPYHVFLWDVETHGGLLNDFGDFRFIDVVKKMHGQRHPIQKSSLLLDKDREAFAFRDGKLANKKRSSFYKNRYDAWNRFVGHIYTDNGALDDEEIVRMRALAGQVWALEQDTVRAFEFGASTLQHYVMGKTENGNWLGIHATSVRPPGPLMAFANDIGHEDPDLATLATLLQREGAAPKSLLEKLGVPLPPQTPGDPTPSQERATGLVLPPQDRAVAVVHAMVTQSFSQDRPRLAYFDWKAGAEEGIGKVNKMLAVHGAEALPEGLEEEADALFGEYTAIPVVVAHAAPLFEKAGYRLMSVDPGWDAYLLSVVAQDVASKWDEVKLKAKADWQEGSVSVGTAKWIGLYYVRKQHPERLGAFGLEGKQPAPRVMTYWK